MVETYYIYLFIWFNDIQAIMTPNSHIHSCSYPTLGAMIPHHPDPEEIFIKYINISPAARIEPHLSRLSQVLVYHAFKPTTTPIWPGDYAILL